MIDPELDMVRIYRRERDVFTRPTELSREAGDVLRTPLIPGLDVPLTHLFKD